MAAGAAHFLSVTRPPALLKWGCAALVLATVATACRTVSPLPPANLAEPGWRVQQGQVVWTPRRGSPDVAGELVVAIHPDGRSLVQFIKTPFPIVVAQTTAARWQIEFVPQSRTIAGSGKPSPRFGWLLLAAVLNGEPAPAPWSLQPTNGNWRLENPRTGERLEGYLLP